MLKQQVPEEKETTHKDQVLLKILKEMLAGTIQYHEALKRMVIHFKRNEFYLWMEQREESHNLKALTILKETPETISFNLALFKEWLKLLGNEGEDCIYDIKSPPIDEFASGDYYINPALYENKQRFVTGTVYSACYQVFQKEIQGDIECLDIKFQK